MEQHHNTREIPRRTNYFMYFSLILLVVIAILSWKLISFQKQIEIITVEKESLGSEKDLLIGKLEALGREYDTLSARNEQLAEMFSEEKANVQKLLAQVNQAKGSLSKYKARVALLENRLREYLQQIEDLKKQNKELIEENFNIKTSLDSTLSENIDLASENYNLNEKVEKGSALITYDLIAEGVVLKAKGKEIPTLRCRKAEKLRVCFTIGENPIASAGTKTVYIRIADPSGLILTAGDGENYSFDYQGKKLQFSAKEEIVYGNKATDVCVYWNKNRDLAPGIYTIDIFADGHDIGTATLRLE